MASLTLKGIPDHVMERLRHRADAERRSLNQEAIRLLETALEEARPSFTVAYDAFLKEHGPSPFDDASLDEALGGLRSREMEWPSPFEDEAAGDEPVR